MTFLPPKLDRALMRSSYEEVTRQRTNYWRPENGPNKLRVLPGWPTEAPIVPFVALSQHFLGGEEKKSYVCPATPGINRDCPICKVARMLKKKASDVEQQIGKDISARHSYLWNIVVRGKESEGVKVYSAPGSAHKEILGYAADDVNWPLFLDMERGADILLEKTGANLQTRYAVRIATPSCPVMRTTAESHALFGSAPDLTQFLKAESDETLLKALKKAQDLDDDDDPVDDGSVLTAAVARASKAVTAAPPAAPKGTGMGLAPAEDEGFTMTVEAEMSAPMETVEVTGTGSVPKVAEAATASVATAVETPDVPVAVPSASAARSDLSALKARLKNRLNPGATS